MDRIKLSKRRTVYSHKKLDFPNASNQSQIYTPKRKLTTRIQSSSNIRHKNLTPPSSNNRHNQLIAKHQQQSADLQKKIIQLERRNSQIHLKYSQELLQQVQQKEALTSLIKTLQKEKTDKQNQLYSHNISLRKQLKGLKEDFKEVISKFNQSLGALQTCIDTWISIESQMDSVSKKVVQSFSYELKYKMNGLLAKYELQIFPVEMSVDQFKTGTFHQLSDYFQVSIHGVALETVSAVKPGELAYRKGDRIEVITSNQDGWCLGKIENQIGVLPRSHIKFSD